MEKKYVGAVVALPLELCSNLDTTIVQLEQDLGFEPSRAEAIAYLLNYYIKHKQKGQYEKKDNSENERQKERNANLA
jgi:hypothetical protein